MTETILNLTVGATLELESTTDDILKNLYSELIGYTHNQSMILSHPKKDNIPVQVDAGDRFYVSMKQSDANVTFETEVIAVLNTPYPHIHTSYPEEIRTGSLRKSNRVPVSPADIRLVMDKDEPETPISILNISVSGARLVSEKRLGVVDNQLQIDIRAGAGHPPVRVSCMIIYVQEMRENNHPIYHHGVEFIGMDAETQLFLWKFVQGSNSTQQQAPTD